MGVEEGSWRSVGHSDAEGAGIYNQMEYEAPFNLQADARFKVDGEVEGPQYNQRRLKR